MEFRPCIDIHNGRVKQIVGSSLSDKESSASENYISVLDAEYYSDLYMNMGLAHGHVIMLNSKDSPYYEQTRQQALKAISRHKNFMQIGGGITADNAAEYIELGASHVIVTSYVFKDGVIDYDALRKLNSEVGADKLVLDLSCRKKGDDYYVVTDRWQKFTEEKLTLEFMDSMAGYCNEFLIHAVDVEGKASGIEEELVRMLGTWDKRPVTYAGGIHNFDDLKKIKEFGANRLNVTIGSALDLFGGEMSFDEVVTYCRL